MWLWEFQIEYWDCTWACESYQRILSEILPGITAYPTLYLQGRITTSAVRGSLRLGAPEGLLYAWDLLPVVFVEPFAVLGIKLVQTSYLCTIFPAPRSFKFFSELKEQFVNKLDAILLNHLMCVIYNKNISLIIIV